MLSTDTRREYGAEWIAGENEHGAESRKSHAAIVAGDGREAIGPNERRDDFLSGLSRNLRSVGVIALFACAVSACSLNGGKNALDEGEALFALPAPAKPGESATPDVQMLPVSTAQTASSPAGLENKAFEQAGSADTVQIQIDGLNLSDAVGLAIARHPDISRSQAIVAQSESEVAVARSAWYPTLEYGVNPKYSRSDNNDTYASVGVNQLIYDFGRSKSRISAASATLEQDRFLLADTIETIAFGTASTFIDLAASQDTIAAAERQVESLRETKDKIETRVKAGLSDASDLNQAEVAIQRAAAEALSAQTQFDVAAGKLAAVTGIRPPTVQSLDATTALIQGFGNDMQDAIDQTPSVKAAQAGMAAAQAKVNLAKAERFPSIGVNAGQDISAIRDSDGNYDRDTWVGLTLTGEFSAGGLNKHRISAAEAEQRAESQVLENQRLVTRTALGSAETEAAGATARLQSYQSVIDLSRSLIDLYWQEYTLDKRPLTDVINAERDVYQSEVARISAVADGDRARIKAKAAVGRFIASLKEKKSASK